MKPIEKAKAQKLINKIQSGQFDENDIDNLFMRLREYSQGFLVFREIADFIAHPKERNQGMINKSLEGFYLSMKFFILYNSANQKLDIFNPFPLWIKTLMLYKVDRCDENILIEKYNVRKARLKIRIGKGFKDNKKNKTTSIVEGKLSQETLEAISFVMSFIYGNSTFTQEQLIDEVIGVIKQNKLNYVYDDFIKHSNCLVLSTLLLLHNATFNFKGYKAGYCQIHPEKESISYKNKFVDVDGNPVEIEQSFGKLCVYGSVILNKDGQDLTVSHTIMSTNLDVEKWCDDSLFEIEPLTDKTPDYLVKRIKFKDNLSMSKSCKLINLTV